MVKHFDDKPEDRALWDRARAAWRGAAATEPAEADPDALTLAAYLEGGLGEAERARVEAWMAGSDAALDLALTAREALRAEAAVAPPALVHRAQAMVGYRASDGRTGWPAWIRALFARPWHPAMSGLAAGLFLMACAGSFELGRQEPRGLSMAQTEGMELDGPDLSLDLEDII